MSRCCALIACFAISFISTNSVVAEGPEREASASGIVAAQNRIADALIEPRLLDPAAQAVDRKLRQKLTVRFDDIALSDALKMLERLGGLPIVFEMKDLMEDGIDLDEALAARLSVTFTETPFKKLLARLLAPHVLLAFLDYDDETIRVVSSKGCHDVQIQRIYPVADLVARRVDRRVVLRHEELSQILQSLIEPETWISSGGQGSILFEPETLTLIIRQEDDVHDQIESFLQSLREQRVRTVELLKAANGPTLEEIRGEQASLEHAQAELLRLERKLGKLERVDEKSAPAGVGAGFFDIGEFDNELRGGFGAGGSLHDIAADARQIALRAMRLAIRFEEEARDRERKLARPLHTRDAVDGVLKEDDSDSSSELRREAELP